MAHMRPSQRVNSVDSTRHQIDNPLRAFSQDQRKQAAEEFADKIHADKALFVRAVEVAYDPPNWENVEGITGEEAHALKEEKKHGFWRQTKTLRITVISLVFSAMTQGWVQSVSNGANQTLPEYFGFKRTDGDLSWKGPSAIWKFAGINAITYLSAGVFGCWFSDPLQAHWLGRRGAIFASACICFTAAIGASCARKDKWWELLIWRCALGLGLGAKASVTPIFGAEISPSHLRGMLVMNWQLFDALGIFFGFTANLVFYWTKNLAWRFQMASVCMPTGCLLVLILTVPESPRWLLKKGRMRESFEALCLLRATPLQAAAELFYAHAQIQMEIKYLPKRKLSSDDLEMQTKKQVNGAVVQHHEDISDISDLSNLTYYKKAVSKTNYWTRIVQLFRNRRTRRATVAASVVMIGQQLCGVNVLAFYSTVFIRDLNRVSSSGLNALWLSWGLGLANFVFTFPAYWGIDRLGRRFLLLSTYPGMILSLLGACLSFLGGTDDERNVRVGVFMFFFIFFYSMGQGPVAFAYSSEVFPLFNREAGMSWAVFVNLVGAGILTLLVPQAQVSTTSSVANQTPSDVSHAQMDREWRELQAKLLGAFVGFGTLSMILIYFFVPETKLAAAEAGKHSQRTINYISLEELNHIFEVQTGKFIKYQITNVLPYAGNYLKWIVMLQEDKPSLKSMHYWAETEKKKNENNQDGNQTNRRRESGEGQALEPVCSGAVQEVQHAAHANLGHGQREQVATRVHRGSESDDMPLRPPTLTYAQSERQGSLDWDPTVHPSPSPSPPPSRSANASRATGRDDFGSTEEQERPALSRSARSPLHPGSTSGEPTDDDAVSPNVSQAVGVDSSSGKDDSEIGDDPEKDNRSVGREEGTSGAEPGGGSDTGPDIPRSPIRRKPLPSDNQEQRDGR